MSARVAALLVVLLLALGGGALLVRHQAASQKPAAAGTLGQPLLKGLKAAEVAEIAIRDPGGELTLSRQEDRWTIAERGGFPAELERVREFVLKALELKIVQAEPIGDKDRERLKLDATGTSIEFRGADGKPLARMVAGKKYFTREPENPERARGDGRFVLLPQADKTVYVVSDPLSQATPKTAEWIRRSGFAAEKLRALEVRFADGEGWKIERGADNADWKLAGARAGEKLEVTRANAASYSLAIMELADVAPAGVKDTGLDKPVTVTATSFDGLVYTLRVGRPQGENYYAALAIAGEPRTEGKDAEDRRKKIQERLARERALAEHTLLIAKTKLEDVLKRRAELLAKQEEKKK
jgi:hypothetical protein